MGRQVAKATAWTPGRSGQHKREGLAEITLSNKRGLLDMAYPKIGNRLIAKITTREVLVVLRSVEATGRYESARRMRSVLSRAFR